MFKNYIKIALRNLLRHKGYSAINILGLAVGMAACLLILLFVLDELSYDRFHKNSDRIYRVTREWFNQDGQSNLHLARVAPPIGPLLKQDFPHLIEKMVRIRSDYNTLLKRGDETFVERRFFWAEPNIFEVFSFPLLKGDPATALTEPNSVVLTESMARKYFGEAEPLGQIINYEDERDLKVTGVVPDVPHNSHFKFDFLGSFVTLNEIIGTETLTSNWGSNNYLTYLLLPETSVAKKLQQQIPDFLDRHLTQLTLQNSGQPPSRQPSKGTMLHLQKLTDIHLHSHLTTEIEPNGDITNVVLFSAIALFILLIACSNFMNLATARSARRAREIGLRKVLGAYRRNLIRQFLGESTLTAVLAMAGAIVLVEVVLPAFNDFIGKELSFDFLQNPGLLLGLITLTVCVGIVAGSYPALFLSSFRPVAVLKGATRTSRTSTFRTVLVVGQFTISIALIVCMGVVHNQMQFLQNKRLGFNEEQVVILPSSAEMREDLPTLESRLRQNPHIRNVSASRLIPSNNLLNSWGGQVYDGDALAPLSFRLAVVEVNYGFFETYEIELLAGRRFSREHATDATEAFILNHTAVEQLGWTLDDAIGKPMQYGSREGRVIGVVEDVHFESLHNEIVPVIYLIDESTSFQVAVRISGEEMAGTLAFLKDVWQDYRPDYPFEYSFLDDEVQALYESEQKLGQVFAIFSVLAVVIASLGLLGLASFTAEQRTKEIGIRKVLGATVSGIVLLFSKEFVRLVAIASVLAWAVAFYGMSTWLETFAYHAEIQVLTFVYAAVLALFVALATVSFQAVRAALANPVESLRYE